MSFNNDVSLVANRLIIPIKLFDYIRYLELSGLHDLHSLPLDQFLLFKLLLSFLYALLNVINQLNIASVLWT